MKPIRHPLAWAIVAAQLPHAALAADEAAAPLELESSVVSASAPLASEAETVLPAAVLEGDQLLKRQAATLGETLQGLPGVRSASFGAGVGRPVLRGMDGTRVKVLSDGADVLDASSVSPDHAVTSEPLLAERIEVLKGPASLLYGGGAIGGVVNVIDRKVPTYVPEKGYEGKVELRANSVANEGSGVFDLTAGSGPFAVHAEGVKRQADEYSIPGSPGKQAGAFSDTDSYTLGTSLIGERGYLGVAYGEQHNLYGLLGQAEAECAHNLGNWTCTPVAGEDGGTPYIDMRQQRWDLRGELSDPLPGFELAKLRVGHSDYHHAEIEGGVAGTRITNNASDARLELTHQPLWGWQGVLGAQTQHRNFAAHGSEAYVPPSITDNHGLFLLEKYTAGAWRYELGLRHEWQDISADGQPSRSHNGNSASAGAVWTFAPEYSLGLSFTRAQRLPSAEELYANGPHAATRTIELGNPDLGSETSRNLELNLRKFAGRTTFSLSLYRNAMSDFIYAADTGRAVGGGYREIAYRQQDALLTGAEGEVRFQASEASALTLFADRVRGSLRGQGGDLPRIPADRFGARLEHNFSSALDGQLELARTRRQNRVADYETQTAGYTMLGANLGYHGKLSASDYTLFLRGDNLLDAKARNNISFIKDDVLLPGRNLTVGLRVSF
jgi:iron complex outermembrane receptor protein